MAEPNYFRISRPASGAGTLTVKFTLAGSSQFTRQIKYRVVGGTGTWFNCINTDLSLGVGAAIEFKSDSDVFYESDTDRVYLEITAGRGASGQVNIGGDITTLLNSTTGNVTDLTGRDYCFAKFFVCESTKIAHNFDDLVLPSTTLAKGCYWQMFARVTGGTVHGEQEPGCAFVLPAQTLAQDAYKEMFSGTAQLVKIKAGVKSDQLNATNSQDWLKNVAARGTFESTDSSFNTSIERSATTVPSGWTITKPEPETGLWLNTKKVDILFINGKQVAELYLNGKQVGYEAPEPPGPDPKLTNFRITNIGNATDNPDDTQQIEVELPPECDMQVYHSDSGSEGALTPGETTTLTLPYGEYVEFWGNNPDGLFPQAVHMVIHCPEAGSYEASGQLSSLAMQDTKEVGYTFNMLFDHNVGLTKADNLVIPDGYDGTTETFSTMFQNCTRLVKGPENIPYASGMYMFYQMFNGCSSLTSVGVDWTRWPSTNNGTKDWLASVASTGTFKCPATLTIPSRDENGVPSGWTIQHT